MRGGIIPDDLAANPYAARFVIGPPDGDLTGEGAIKPVEALIDYVELDGTAHRRFTMRMVLSPDERQAITDGADVWVSVLGPSLVPFAVEVTPPDPATSIPVERRLPPGVVHEPGLSDWVDGDEEGPFGG